MPRRLFRRLTERFAPAIARISCHPAMRRYTPALAEPDLWHLNRRSTARGVAVGLFCGLIPGPFQAAAAAGACVAWRANFPLAVLTTFYTNPLTIVPLYWVAYRYGALFVPGTDTSEALHPPPPFGGVVEYLGALYQWVLGLGAPLAIGLPLLAMTLAVIGYFAVRIAWRVYAVSAWRRRAQRHAQA
jgi:uncharacterized protein (DUF2062 family)